MTIKLWRVAIYLLPLILTSCVERENAADSSEQHNHLINEKSPYLLQHAHNPVDWYPWSEAALDKAKKENKLLVISIGYSSCHWCHVMEKESFSDTAVSRLMNEHFVSIKVDREERPDIDNIYMTACQIAQGDGCGWPLNAIALPDGKPVYAGTYYPKAEWMRLLEYFVKMYDEEPEKLKSFSEQLTDGIRQNELEGLTGKSHDWTKAGLDSIMDRMHLQVDKERGGKKGAPKFPMPNNFELFLQHHYLTGVAESKEAAEVTLEAMALGGIFDQLGGGFARYSTDPDWRVPHFEKMLYDNAQLVSLYSNAYKWKPDPLYKEIVLRTLEFTDNELSESNGGFYSSIDADSEGEEGTFYVWTEDEIRNTLKDEALFELAKRIYGIETNGNWEKGKNVLYQKERIQQIAIETGSDEKELLIKKRAIDDKLTASRKERVRPHTDDKVLTSWNALMTIGYLDAYLAFGEEAYLKRAEKNEEFISKFMFRTDSSLWRNYRNGSSGIKAFLEDYAHLISAYLKFYQVTFDESYLNKAEKLVSYTLDHFQDEDGFFLFSEKDGSTLIARKKEISDNVIPSSNSVMAKNLYLLGTLLYREEWKELGSSMLSKVMEQARDSEYPSYYSNWIQLAYQMAYPLFEVAIVGEEAVAFNRGIQNQYLPNAIFLGGKEEGNMELLKDKLQEGATYIYVCRNKVCKLPVQEIEQALPLVRP